MYDLSHKIEPDVQSLNPDVSLFVCGILKRNSLLPFQALSTLNQLRGGREKICKIKVKEGRMWEE